MNAGEQKTVIYEIQNYLRELYRGKIISQQIVPTGVYDSQTTEAVRELQGLAGLPQTGTVDLSTWIILSDAAKELRGINGGSNPIYPFEMIAPRGSVSFGERSDLVYIIQIMLKSLLRYDFSDITLSGIYDRETLEAVKKFQKANGLPENGSVNKRTWNSLAAAYNLGLSELH